MPGSRNSEVRELLGLFRKTALHLKSYPLELGLVQSPSVDKALYEPYLDSLTTIFSHKELAKALQWADLGLAASGTVTLTCALFELPTVVAYRGSLFNEFIFYHFIQYRGYISLTNLVYQKEVFPEFIQEKSSSYNLAKALEKWINDEKSYQQTKVELSRTLELLRGEEENVGHYMGEIIHQSYEK